MPIVFITYSLAYLDRANYSFAAAAGINADLGITKGMSSLLAHYFSLAISFPNTRRYLRGKAQCPQTDFCLYFSGECLPA